MRLIFLYGPPAVGKLTIARRLAELTGLRVFHNHLTVDLLQSVFDFGSEPFVELREQIWLSVFRAAARSDTSLIFTFAGERTVRPGFPAKAARAVEDGGGRTLFVELTCPDAELERRAELPERGAFGKLSSRELYRELRDAGAFDYPSLPSPDLSIDTVELDPDEAAQRIASHLA